MSLTIKAINYKGQPLKPPLTAIFDEQGGSLGRSSDNYLILADEEKVVSGKHASIEYDNGCYYYVDNSLNGTQITNRNQWVHNEKIQLKDQDELRVGDYDLILSISDASFDASPPQQSIDEEDSFFSVFNNKNDQDSLPFRETNNGAEPSAFFPGDDHNDKKPEPVSPVNSGYGHRIDGNFAPPDPIEEPKQSNEIPDAISLQDFFGEEARSKNPPSETTFSNVPKYMENGIQNGSDKLPDEQVTRVDVDVPSEPLHGETNNKQPEAPLAEKPEVGPEKIDADLSKAVGDQLGAFLKSAGIEDSSFLAQEKSLKIMETVGTVFRELIDGLMTVLRGRTRLKSQLRVSMTILRPAENNPLKFSPTVDEALKLLLATRHPGFLGAVDAVHEGYEDVKNHQLAITAGVQASLVKILKRFDPEKFTEKYEEGFIFQKKAKCWDEYRQLYPKIVEAALEDFFGDEFVRAYEEQMDKLRAPHK